MAMKEAASLVLCLVALAAGHSHSTTAKDGPVQKVIVMLQQNKMKVLSDLQAEEKEVVEYTSFCDTETGAKTMAIKMAARKIEELDATISDATAESKALDDEIAALGAEMASKDKEMAAAAETRKAEHEDFVGVEKELLASLDELEKAVVVMKREMASKSALTQVGAKQLLRNPKMQAVAKSLSSIVEAAWLDHGSKQYLQGLLQQGGEAKDSAVASASSDESEGDDLRLRHKASMEAKNDGLLGTFMDMKEKAEVTLSNARSDEMKSAFTFQMMKQSLEEAMHQSKTKLSDATETKAALEEESGKAQGEKVEAKKTKLADSMYLSSLTNECEETAQAWAERQKSASDECAAIDKAKEILESRVKAMLQFGGKDEGKNSGADKEEDTAAEKAAEQAAGVAQYDDDKSAALRQRLVRQLKELGHEFHSYAMMEMVSAAATDPFEKIRGLISDMIAKLLAEASEEASQKSFCDEEKAKSNAAKDATSTKIDKTTSRIDKAVSESETLKNTIKELQAELAEIDKGNGEAIKLRSEEHANYLKASKDYKDAAEAVEDAIGVLKEFYSANALVQTNARTQAHVQAPKFGGAKGDAGNSIIQLLEVSAEDFTRLFTEEESKEMEAKAVFDKTMQESKIAIVSKTAELKAAESQIKQLAVAIKNYQEDRTQMNEELDAVVAYLEKLKPQCETKVLTYEEKKAKREAEIEGLKEALGILEGGAALVQQPRVLRGISAAKI